MRKIKFRDPKTLTKEQLTDPFYSLKEIRKLAKKMGFNKTACSQCHHCR